MFIKSTSSIAGAYDPVNLPADAVQTDGEIELAVAIGSTAKNVTEDKALAHDLGNFILNDVSDRGWPTEREGQWRKGKSHDRFGPMDPWRCTADAVPDLSNQSLTLDAGGVWRQNGSTGMMIFGMPTMDSDLGHVTALHPGDVMRLEIEGPSNH